MRYKTALLTCIIWTYTSLLAGPEDKDKFRWPHYVVTKSSFGMIGGLERGKYTFLELGLEAHWKKFKLRKAPTIALNANMEYNFLYNILGYNSCFWFKIGRVNLTYGLNLNYITDFDRARYGLGPQIGFRLLGFHLVNGYNFYPWGDAEVKANNTFYIGLRYYFPLDAKTRVRNKNKD
ncbi:MAG TPA: hypothetical protein VL947_03870 [Cytophagales bacterium]|nr:hypothetical protein [Cytophagales bacterium]